MNVVRIICIAILSLGLFIGNSTHASASVHNRGVPTLTAAPEFQSYCSNGNSPPVPHDCWGVAAVTATPEFLPDGSVYSYTVRTRYGWGMRAKKVSSFDPPMMFDFSYEVANLFIPVSTSRTEVGPVNMIWMRAVDDLQGGNIQATLLRIPRDTPGPQEVIGSVQTSDTYSSADGYQFVSGSLFGTPQRLSKSYDYYIQISMWPGFSIFVGQPPTGDLTVYDVGLSMVDI